MTDDPRNSPEDYAHVEAVLREAINDAYRLGIGAAIEALVDAQDRHWTTDGADALSWCIQHLRQLSLMSGAPR